MHKNIILIGGAPTSGKSFIARKLSEELKIPLISTDNIRSFMKEIVNEADCPDLFYFTKQKPDEYLSNTEAQQIVKDQNKESYDVWRGVESFIKTNSNWDSFIIEGVAILPGFIVKKDFLGKQLKPFFILDDNKERIREVIYGRGLWASAKKYSDDLKPKEIEWVIAFNSWLENELKKYDYPIIKYKDKELNVLDFKEYL